MEWTVSMATAAIPGLSSGGAGRDSPAKEKLFGRAPPLPLLLLRARNLRSVRARSRAVLFAVLSLLLLLLLSRHLSPFVAWKNPHASSASVPSRGGYAVLINTWKRNSLLKQVVSHYASCSRAEAIHVVWSEIDPPSDGLKSHLEKLVSSKSHGVHKPSFRFELCEEDNLNNRFKPIEDLKNDAVFSVDDDVIVPCSTLDFAFTVWQSASDTMVGFVPRTHWLVKKDGLAYYTYGGWWSVWWMGTYSMVLSKAAFFHRKYLDLYTHKMPSSIHDYVTRERNCEDIAMSLLIANASGAPPVWVKGNLYEIGSSGISSMKGHNERRNKCLNDFISLYETMPLVSTSMKAVDTRQEWFW
ncbi:glycosyltransferase family 64 protein C4 [Dioscorea cayenensis subsp. rotundata]|uniref:Glycosyltransferase family 64 protein C4 n=1 Tax=Dioscorea cayennensis subsp. rotundata TaxID=55577 RepID=A0AB40C3W5_DIOCR|nr:glycosyltransferase family 64 protein C4 [Dioscorea cayenensis subsp. rotundata]